MTDQAPPSCAIFCQLQQLVCWYIYPILNVITPYPSKFYPYHECFLSFHNYAMLQLVWMLPRGRAVFEGNIVPRREKRQSDNMFKHLGSRTYPGVVLWYFLTISVPPSVYRSVAILSTRLDVDQCYRLCTRSTHLFTNNQDTTTKTTTITRQQLLQLMLLNTELSVVCYQLHTCLSRFFTNNNYSNYY